jgi:hypothetical protein
VAGKIHSPRANSASVALLVANRIHGRVVIFPEDGIEEDREENCLAA